jgi:hypothetical protein
MPSQSNATSRPTLPPLPTPTILTMRVGRIQFNSNECGKVSYPAPDADDSDDEGRENSIQFNSNECGKVSYPAPDGDDSEDEGRENSIQFNSNECGKVTPLPRPTILRMR